MVDRRTLSSSRGTAEFVPHALSRLCSREESEREAAYRLLDNGVVLQGTLFDSAPFVALEVRICRRSYAAAAAAAT